jgi:glutamate-1-semialdehyde 2,1-aminomutase
MSNAATDMQREIAVDARQSILAEYRARTAGSAALFQRASRVLTGGTTGNLRHFSPYPLYFGSGTGSTMTDVDGNAYIDCFLCNGPLLLGHRHPKIVEALRQHATVGSIVVNPELAVLAGEMVQRTVPCAERVRFLNSGTEAVMAAIRVARAATRKPKIVKFYGHYHGQDDQFLFGLEPSPVAFGAGIPSESHANTVLVRYGDMDSLASVLGDHDDVAAVILDPAMHSGGLWGSSSAYLREVRELTARRGVVLIFDEVITGFRLGAGGAQALHGVTPDLATFAKALGAGEKLAAVAGRESLLRCLDPHRPAGTPVVFQSGTGNDGTAALAAGHAAVSAYRELEQDGGYVRLNGLGERLAQGLRQAFAARGVPFHANQLGPMLQLFFSGETPGFERFARLPVGPLQLFYLALINEGVLLSLPTSNHIYLSFAHTNADIETVLAKVGTVLDRYDFREIIRADLVDPLGIA